MHRVEYGSHALLDNSLDVGPDPPVFERHALETHVKADPRQAELVGHTIDLDQRVLAVGRLDHADGNREVVGVPVAVGRDALVDPLGCP